MPKTSPLTGRAGDGKLIPPRTVHVNSYGVLSYRRRKIGVGMQLAGRAVHVIEDRSVVRVQLGYKLLRELLIGPRGQLPRLGHTHRPSARVLAAQALPEHLAKEGSTPA